MRSKKVMRATTMEEAIKESGMRPPEICSDLTSEAVNCQAEQINLNITVAKLLNDNNRKAFCVGCYVEGVAYLLGVNVMANCASPEVAQSVADRMIYAIETARVNSLIMQEYLRDAEEEGEEGNMFIRTNLEK